MIHDCTRCIYYTNEEGRWYCEFHEEQEDFCTAELEEMNEIETMRSMRSSN